MAKFVAKHNFGGRMREIAHIQPKIPTGHAGKFLNSFASLPESPARNNRVLSDRALLLDRRS